MPSIFLFCLQLVNEKDVSHSSSDVRQLDSSGYLSVPPGSGANEVSDSNSPESNTQSFLSYLQDHAASTGGNGKTFTFL